MVMYRTINATVATGQRRWWQQLSSASEMASWHYYSMYAVLVQYLGTFSNWYITFATRTFQNTINGLEKPGDRRH